MARSLPLFGRAALAVLVGVVAVGCGIPNRDNTWTEPDKQLFDTGPYMVLGEQGTAYIIMRAHLGDAPEVDWWPVESAPQAALGQAWTGQGATTAVAFQSRDLWVAPLEGLPETGEVSYRVRSTIGTTEAYTFRAGRRNDEPFRFAVFGDTRTNHSVHRAVVEAMDRERIDLIVHTGDMVDRGGVRSQWDRFFQIERPLLVDTPMLPSIGNHDMGNREYFRHYFLHALWANSRRYYRRDWGNVRFVAMDGGIECREGCAQYAFVDSALEDAANKDMMVVMFLHYPPYSSGYHGSDEAVQGPIRALARTHGVELVVAGHDHDYERTKPMDGTTYIVSGSAGAPIRAVKPQPFSAALRTEPHYVLVDAESDRLTVRAVNLAGDVFDTYVIERTDPKR